MPAASRTLRVEAIILRHIDWGEADRILTLYTREEGKLRAIAKGVRKVTSRKAGHLEPFTRSALLLARGHDLWIVSQAEAQEVHTPISQDLTRFAYASYVVELLDRFTYEEGENRRLYQLLSETLQRIATLENPYLAVRYYDIRLLDLLGFRPELHSCVSCGAVIQPENQYFSAQLGGAVCPTYGLTVSPLAPVSMPTLKYLRHLQRSSWNEAQRANPTPEIRQEMETLLQNYFTYLLEHRLNTPRFLREVREEW